MSHVIQVLYQGKPVGAVALNEKTGICSFEYEPSFVRSGLQLAPLTMPLGSEIFSFPELKQDSFYGLPGLLSDSLPDRFGQELIRRWMQSHGRSQLNAIEKLSYIGSRGMGALEFKPSIGSRKKKSEIIHLDQIADIADKILAQRSSLEVDLSKDEKEALSQIIQIGSSAGGARAKALVHWNRQTDQMKSGQVPSPDGFEAWLLKFDSRSVSSLGDPVGYGRVEFVYNQLAVECGLHVSEFHLFQENHSRSAHFMSKRFDRMPDGGKVHMLTLCGLAHFDFNQPARYSYEDLMEVCLKLQLPHSQIVEVFKRMIFNVVARNQDDHTRNTAFIMDSSGSWSLSPAYDICWAFNSTSDWVSRHQLSINGKTDGLCLHDFHQIADRFHIPSWREILEKTISTLSHWPERARDAQVDQNLLIAVERSHRLQFPIK